MACTGAYATPKDFADFFCLQLDLTEADNVAMLNRVLTLAAADIHGPLSAVGGCNCASPAWALELLKKWNCIDAACFYKCTCGPELTVEERRMYLEWMDRQATMIRTSQLDLCGGTGAEYPAFGSVELNLTSFNEARIIANRIQRTP